MSKKGESFTIRRHSFVLLEPVVEPHAPELHDHERSIWLELEHALKLLDGVRLEVGCQEHAGEAAGGTD